MGPIGAAGLFAIRLAIFRLPEPEIQLPGGIDLKLTVLELPADAPSFDIPDAKPVPSELAEWLEAQPTEVTKPTGTIAADKINMAFAGTRDELVNAFRAAGWFAADSLTPRTLSRNYKSYTRQTGYPEAPVSKLHYRGEEPDIVFQRSFNTISMRHHIRLWKVEDPERELWLGAATHDIGVEFNKSAMTFTHKIDPRIDIERSKVVNDLVFANCAESPRYVERPRLVNRKRDGREIVTDGRLAVVTLKACGASSGEPEVAPNPPQTRLARIARRMMLEGRQYALRGNAYYWTYRAFKLRLTGKVDLDLSDE